MFFSFIAISVFYKFRMAIGKNQFGIQAKYGRQHICKGQTPGVVCF